jgi:hypothetical protein
MIWILYCDDVDCWDCSPLRNKELLASSPAEWNAEAVVKRLQVLGYTCDAGNPFYGAEQDGSMLKADDAWIVDFVLK